MYRLSFLIVLFAYFGHAQKPGIHGAQFKVDCKECHNSGGWKIDMAKFAYNHDSTGFVLEGMHKKVDCKSCHKTLVFNEANGTCVSCHTDVHSMSVGNDCARCHTANSWLVDNIPELHEQNGFPLLGAHKVLACADCHKSETTLKWDRIGNECVACHRDDYVKTQHPNHAQSNLSTDCITCHDPNSNSWGTGNFHSQFPLKLGHEIPDCKTCHKTNDYASTSPECVTCHKKDFDNTLKPNHVASGYSNNCVECHSPTPFSWQIKDFHLNFPLTLGHDVADCKKCHKNPDYKDISTECVSCHKTDFDNSTAPPHQGSGFSTNCTQCHSPSPVNWTVPGYHNSFPLTQGHNVPDCKACHKTNNFPSTSTECVSCHKTDFDNTTKPSHLTSGFSTNCIECHSASPINWSVSNFHLSFPLTLGHDVPDCKTCHKGVDYKDISKECVSCHKTDFDNSNAPPHVGSGFATSCTDCHSPSPVNWTVPGYHNSFPLTLGHNVSDCKACHKTNNYPATSTACVSCHQTDFDNSAAPPHVGSGYSTNCTDCHSASPIDWTVPGYHNSFPLTQGHNVTDCKTCHKTNNYPATSTACVSCHQTDYNNTAAPPHSGSGYSTNCTDCHSPSPVNWNISGYHGAFPLTQGHNITDCKACHKTSNYPATSPDCISCHATDYNNVANPNHKSNNFSTNCLECHTTAPGWDVTAFKQHDALYFPINSGKHQGEWNLCIDCHKTSGNYKAFTCIDCHEHNTKTKVDDDHKSVSGYSYTSSACYNCHPDGKN